MKKTVYAFAASSAALAVTILCTSSGRPVTHPGPLIEKSPRPERTGPGNTSSRNNEQPAPKSTDAGNLSRAEESPLSGKQEAYRKIEAALLQGSREAVEGLSESIPETDSPHFQRDAVSALISLANDNNGHALSALAQMLPFMRANADRKEAMGIIEEKWGALGDETRAEIKASLELHMRSGALSHWAYFPERRFAKRLLE
jgi:hypothetical protein